MKHLLSVILFWAMATSMVSAQKYFTKTGQISFNANTSIEKIEAINKSASCVMDVETGKIEFGVLVKGFQFEKALMQEHFNENYLESSKFPKATFKGQIDNYKKIDTTKDIKVPVKVTGDLTIHGVTKKITTDGTIQVKSGKLQLSSMINVLLADYKVTVPALVKDQISKTVKIQIDATLEPLK